MKSFDLRLIVWYEQLVWVTEFDLQYDFENSTEYFMQELSFTGQNMIKK